MSLASISLEPEFWEEIKRLAKEENISVAREVADRIVFMDAGKIIEDAEPEKFFNAPETRMQDR